MLGSSRIPYILAVSMLSLVVATAMAFLLQDVYQPTEFLTYRLSMSLQNGHGLVYNPGDDTLTTLTPVLPLLLSLMPTNPHIAANVIFILAITGSAGLLAHTLVTTATLSPIQSITIISVILVAWPLWADFRGTSAPGFLLILIAYLQSKERRWVLSGIITAVAILTDLHIVIPGLMLGIYASYQSHASRFWAGIALPLVVVGAIALLIFDDLLIIPDRSATVWQDGLWVLLFVIAVISLQRAQIHKSLWIFPLWATCTLFSELALSGQLTVSGNLPLAITIGVMVALSIQRFGSIIGVGIPVTLAIIFVLFPPTTPADLQAEITLADQMNIPSTSTLTHPYTDALPYFINNFRGSAYRSDGGYNREFRDMVQRGDTQSMLIATSPDYILLTDGSITDFNRLGALQYEPITATNLYERNTNVATMLPATPSDIIFNPDVSLVSFALDQTRPQAGQQIRLRLSWQINTAPEGPVGLNISLIDPNGTPVASALPTLDQSIWQAGHLHTYHTLRLNSDVEPGLLSLQLTVEYRAGLVGRSTLTQLVTPFDGDLPTQQGIAQLGDVELYATQITHDDNQLSVTTTWSVTNPLNDDYLIFMHLTPMDNFAPVSQSDGPPISGRFPTSQWLPGEGVIDERSIPLAEVAPGQYQIRVGFYLLDGTRLSDKNGDAITIAQVTINPDGEIIITYPNG